MKLWVTWPDSVGEGEHDDVHDVADEAAADTLLKTQPRGWCEATLCDDAGARPTRRRLPRSGWVDVRWWPGPHDVTFLGDDVKVVADWLRAAGVRLSWPQALRAPWAGRQRGNLCGHVCSPPDETLRTARRKGRRALDAVVGLIMQDGMERGALLLRREQGVDELRRWVRESARDVADLQRQLHDANNEIRRLKGEPEQSEDEVTAAQRENVKRWVDEMTGRSRR